MDASPGKLAAARRALEFVEDGMVLGIGSGSTVNAFIGVLGDAVRERRLACSAVVASVESETNCQRAGIPLLDPPAEKLALVIDGADVVTPAKDVLKGHGGALVREKVLAAAATRWILIVDASKWRENLEGVLPVEIIRYGAERTRAALEAATGTPFTFRMAGNDPYRTDNGNFIVNTVLPMALGTHDAAASIQAVPGVVGHGLFLDFHPEVIIGEASGKSSIR